MRDQNLRYKSQDNVLNVVDSTLVMKENIHSGIIITLDRAKGVTVTLPPSTGRGARYTLIVRTAPTSGDTTIKVANTKDVFNGSQAFSVDDDGEGATGFSFMAEADDDTLTLNGTTKGGLAGARVEIVDYCEGYYTLTAFMTQSGSSVTPFSASV